MTGPGLICSRLTWTSAFVCLTMPGPEVFDSSMTGSGLIGSRLIDSELIIPRSNESGLVDSRRTGTWLLGLRH